MRDIWLILLSFPAKKNVLQCRAQQRKNNIYFILCVERSLQFSFKALHITCKQLEATSHAQYATDMWTLFLRYLCARASPISNMSHSAEVDLQ